MDKSAFQNEKVINKFVNTAGKIAGNKFTVLQDQIKDGFIDAFYPFRMFAVTDKKSLIGNIQKMLKNTVCFYCNIFFHHANIFRGIHIDFHIHPVKKQIAFMQMKKFAVEGDI